MTGPQLADALERLLKQRPDIARTKLGHILRNKSNAIDDIRKWDNPKPATVAKVLAFIANPPAEACYIPMDKRRRPGPARNQRRIAAIRRSTTNRAMARIEKGLSAESASDACTRFAQREIEARILENKRLDDPIEQALLKVRKTRIVYRASVHGGPHDRFYISGKGRETISEKELLKLAQKVA